ncbi:MAG: 1-acyl-sn-glycerol-3-phosphate acyltransferase [Acholeplasmataceae bacterium]|nr:1-acyl-sn-glycerol-3-phosphate acyltransferase [Acholeplasmataceae bacterium]
MKRKNRDKQQAFLMNLIRPLVHIWMRMDAKRKVTVGQGVNFKRKEPYIMLANHTFLFDVIHVPLRFRKVPFIVASQTLFKKQPTKFLVTQVAHVIPKAKGASDTSTVRDLISTIRRGYPILIFPEGDTTFYGETNYIEESTMKLIKKLEVDVLTCHVSGGYLSKPRWATGKRKNRQIHLNYQLTIPKEKIKELEIEDINTIIKDALYHNDYDYQRKHMIPHPGKKLAEGIENVVYVCPFCESVNTIESKNNHIRCTSCHHEGTMDEYGFIHDFKYDSLLEWNKFQRNFSAKLRDTKIHSSGFLNYMSIEDDHLDEVGEIEIDYHDFKLHISGALEEIIPIKEISNATITLRRDFGFIFNDKHYLVKLNQSGAALLRIVQDKY